MAHKEKTIPIIVYLDEKTKEEISALAKKTRRSRTMEIRLAIEAHLESAREGGSCVLNHQVDAKALPKF